MESENKACIPHEGLWSYVCVDLEHLIKEYLLPKQKWSDLHHILLADESYFVHEITATKQRKHNIKYSVNAWLLAVQKGYLKLIQWMYSFLNTKDKDQLASAFVTGPVSSLDIAAGCGHLELVQWFHTVYQDKASTYAMDWAAFGGYLDIVKWLHFNRTEGCTTDAMDSAARRGHLDVVKWLHCNRKEGCTTNAMDYASSLGFFKIVAWLHQNRTEGYTARAWKWAQVNGHFVIAKYLIGLGI